MPLTLASTNEEKVVGNTINPTTSTGKPATIQPGSLTVSIQDGNPNSTAVITGENSFDVISGEGADAIGTTTFKVSGDADLGEGVEEVADLVTYNVSGSTAKNLGLTAGTNAPK